MNSVLPFLRYPAPNSSAARERESALCCLVRYRGEYLDVIPAEIIERDYGCGDPTPFVRPGDTVLDLGSGGGSVDCIVSNCVLNLVRPEDRHQLFARVFRVLRLGGRVAISDIVSDETFPTICSGIRNCGPAAFRAPSAKTGS